VSIAGAVQKTLDDFRAAGIRAVSDPRDVNPPCVLLIMPRIEFRFDKGRADLEWSAYLVAGNSGQPSQTDALSALVDDITGLRPFTTGTAYNLPLPGGGDPVPAYLVTWRDSTPIGKD
jgi:hypothetical protein